MSDPKETQQTTDAVTQSNVKVVAEAPANAMGNVCQSSEHSTGQLFNQSIHQQNNQFQQGMHNEVNGFKQLLNVGNKQPTPLHLTRVEHEQ